jgi:cytochrome c
MMPAHPQLTEAQASAMVAYILSLGQPRTPSLPVRGAYTPPASADSSAQGVVVLRASYTDRGANGVRSATTDRSVVLRAPILVVAEGEMSDGIDRYKGPEVPVEITIGARSGGFVGFKSLDLTGVSAIVLSALAPVPNVNSAGGKVEIRLDSATGAVIGETAVIAPQAAMVAPSPLRATLKPTAGAHDVYFVFRNDQAKEGQNLLVLLTAAFERSRPPK